MTGDCFAVTAVMATHNYTNSASNASALVLNAGLDVDCGDLLNNYTLEAVNGISQKRYCSHLEFAEIYVAEKLVTMDTVDQALINQFLVKLRLGLFDPVDSQKYMQYSPDVINSDEHKALALRAVRESVVLLKNDNGLLPIAPSKNMAVLGPNCLATDALLGNYFGSPEHIVSMCEGVKAYKSETKCFKGCDINSTVTDGFKTACLMAKVATNTILVMGLDTTVEQEGNDRDYLVLPGNQNDFIEAMAECSPTPIVLVMVNGGPVDISAAVANPKVGAILYAGNPMISQNSI